MNITVLSSNIESNSSDWRFEQALHPAGANTCAGNRSVPALIQLAGLPAEILADSLAHSADSRPAAQDPEG